MRPLERFNADCYARNYGWPVTWWRHALCRGRNRAVKLTLGRVAQSFGSILALLGTPARAPKQRGKSDGWIKGKQRRPRIRYPVVKKGFSRPRKLAKNSP